MTQASFAESAPQFRTVHARVLIKAFYALAALALLSAGISLAGRWMGQSIALAGHTDDPTAREVVIGNNVLDVPANAIRFEHARRDGVADRLDLYLRWPDLSGYTAAARDDFNHAGGRRSVLFLTFERQIMSRDMSGRFEPIYSAMIRRPGTPGPGGTTAFEFDPKSGYLNEVLVVAGRGREPPFVARCLAGPDAETSLAPCERDVLVGEHLSLTYRFPRELLGDWPALEKAVLGKASALLKTGGAQPRSTSRMAMEKL